MASTKYVKNKIEKLTGQEMKSNRKENEDTYELWTKYKNEIISIISQENQVVTIHSRRENDESNPLTGYSAGVYWDNVKQLINTLS